MTIAQPFILESLPINLSTLKLTDEQFARLCLSNPELFFESTAAGVLARILIFSRPLSTLIYQQKSIPYQNSRKTLCL